MANESNQTSSLRVPARDLRGLLIAVFAGITFGFLLQKGGVGKYNVLIGQLLLEDFTVVKIMLTAIIVGMIGIFVLHRLGLVELHVKKVRLASNTIGGLVFGAGFALMAYCPGTGAVALGQGNWDVLFGFGGLIAGSYVFAQWSGRLERGLKTWGVRQTKTLPELLRRPTLPVAFITAACLIAVLFVIESVLS